MGKNVVIISTTLRQNGNSEMLAKAFMDGAQKAGNNVTFISLRNKNITFCKGCFACQKLGHCIIKDDAIEIEQQVLNADVVVWATPIYYYEMSGQMKTLIDRLNPMYSKDYKFKDVYLLLTAAENEEYTPKHAIGGIQGWIDCFDKVELKGTLFCGDVNDINDIVGNPKLQEAFKMGEQV